MAAPGGIGSPADLVRSSQLHWGSPRLGDGSWLLLQYLAERDGDQLLGTLWREAEAGEDPLTTYKRLTGLSQADLNRRVAEYAMRTVAWDFMDRSAIAAGVDRLDPVLLADRTTPVEPVEGDPATTGCSTRSPRPTTASRSCGSRPNWSTGHPRARAGPR